MLNSAFDGVWPKLQRKLAKIPLTLSASQSATQATPSRPTPQLSELATRILLAAVAGERHTVTMNSSNHGFTVGAGGTGLVSTKDDREQTEYRAAVGELLNQNLIEDRWGNGEVFAVTKPGYSSAEELRKQLPPELTDEAKQILRAATKGPDGQVMLNWEMEGFHVFAGGESVCSTQDDRVKASYRHAIDDLAGRKLLRNEGNDNYEVTPAGYAAATGLTPPKPAAPAVTDDNDILALLLSWMKGRPAADNTSAIKFAEVDQQLNLPPGSALRLLEQAAAKLSYFPDTKGQTVIVFKRVPRTLNAPQVINPRPPFYGR